MHRANQLAKPMHSNEVILFLSTEPPSMPRNVQVIDQTSNSVTLSWEEPEDLGGRDDLSYVLCAELDGMMDCTTVMETTGTITGMS